MGFKKRLAAILAIAAVSSLVIAVALSGKEIRKVEENTPLLNVGKDSVYLWYTDEALTDYLNSAAVTYNEEHDVRVIPILHSGLEYLEDINRASLNGEQIPDLYVVSHDSLEKAHLAGLAGEISYPERKLLNEVYLNTGLMAATYQGQVIGYPFYFETSALLYNKTYLDQMSESSGETVDQLLPKTIEDVKTFADQFDAPEEVEAVFRWDVTDIFYNYFFVGNAINMGGEAGDDLSQIDIYNENAIKSLRAYEELNQFFSIDTGEVSYKNVIQEFAEGKLVFTVATSDVVSTLEQAKEDGIFTGEYGITLLPDVNETIKAKPLSMTQCIAINEYSSHQQEANDFAAFLTSTYSDSLYARTGKVSAARGMNNDQEALLAFAEEYEHSVPMPKMIETGNFWVQLEVLFSKVWNGADANEMLRELSETIMQQVTGKEYTETVIEEKMEEENEEYLDEEVYLDSEEAEETE